MFSTSSIPYHDVNAFQSVYSPPRVSALGLTMGSRKSEEQDFSSRNSEERDTVHSSPPPKDPDEPTNAMTKSASEPFSKQFLDGSETATKARRMYIKILLQRTCIIIVAMFGIFSIYWAAVSHVLSRPLGGCVVVRLILSSMFTSAL